MNKTIIKECVCYTIIAPDGDVWCQVVNSEDEQLDIVIGKGEDIQFYDGSGKNLKDFAKWNNYYYNRTYVEIKIPVYDDYFASIRYDFKSDMVIK